MKPIHPTHVQVFYMFESDSYPFASDTITRTLYFPQPLATTKIKLDKMMGASGFVIQVEFIGMDPATKERHLGLPFQGGKVLKSKKTKQKFVLKSNEIKKHFSSGADWLTFYADQFDQEQIAPGHDQRRLIENLLDTGKIFIEYFIILNH